MKVARHRSRLLLSIYLVGLVQLVVAGVAIVVVHRVVERAPWEHEPARARGLILALGEMYDSPALLARAMARLDEDHASDVAFYRLDGTLVAATRGAPPALSAEELERLSEARTIQLPKAAPGATTAVVIERDGAVVGYGLARGHGPWRRDGVHAPPPAQFRPPPYERLLPAREAMRGPPPRLPSLAPNMREPVGIAVALMAAAVISVLFARSLARPLARLAGAAEAFGSGDLTARANINRKDEIGAVARTFDEMAERVNALLRTQREFLANVSHELRTPLARIRVALDIAAEGDVDAARQSLGEIAQDWDDLDRLVEALLAIARLDLAKDPAVPAAALRDEVVDGAVLAERAAGAFRSLHPTRPLAIEHDDDLRFIADGGMLRRVLDNLLVNAAKYSEAGTPIRLQARRQGSDIEFSVHDHGHGIDAADLPFLFQPFFRTDRTRTRKTGGVGLGLALAKRIVDAHGGNIRVDSRLGVGTTVSFRVPARRLDS
jgi:signal transduction histidine kinase